MTTSRPARSRRLALLASRCAVESCGSCDRCSDREGASRGAMFHPWERMAEAFRPTSADTRHRRAVARTRSTWRQGPRTIELSTPGRRADGDRAKPERNEHGRRRLDLLGNGEVGAGLASRLDRRREGDLEVRHRALLFFVRAARGVAKSLLSLAVRTWQGDGHCGAADPRLGLLRHLGEERAVLGRERDQASRDPARLPSKENEVEADVGGERHEVIGARAFAPREARVDSVRAGSCDGSVVQRPSSPAREIHASMRSATVRTMVSCSSTRERGTRRSLVDVVPALRRKYDVRLFE